MKLSVIVPCYNAANTIAAQLEALASQYWSEPWEIIISDNGSTDESLSIVEGYKRRLPNLQVIDSSDRQGTAHARNVGVQAAGSHALPYCDADDEVAPGWLVAMYEALSKHNFVASRFDTEKLNALWVQKSHGNPQRDGLNKYRYPPYLPHAGGSGLGVKRSLHAAVGGFDESMPTLEDTDYCWRIQLAGTELHFVQDAVVHVRYRDTIGGIYRQARSYAENNVLLYKKYQPLGMPRLSWKTGLQSWAHLLWRLPRIRDKASLATWLWGLGWRLGRVKGCIRYRVFAL